jgi:large conductance mechanosensitive channel
MSLFKEFKEFALKGNVIDLAIGVIIGAAFGRIITSLVDDIIMPPIGYALGDRDFSNYFLNLSPGTYATLAEAKAAGAATINYGLFLGNIFDFLVIALAIFLIIKRVNKWQRAPEAAAPNVRECPECLSAIPLTARRCRFCCVTV